jgi:GNAT superfamily N-acetyltransferase
VRLARLDNADGVAAAVALVMDDRDSAVMLAMAVDPETRLTDASQRILASEAHAASERGLKKLIVVTGALEHEPPPLPITKVRSMRVSVYGQSKSASLARHYGALRRRVEAARVAPGAAAAGARAAWSTIRTAAANVAGRERLHLYRGEMWTRGIPPTDGLELSVMGEADFDALDDRSRGDIRELLELDLDYCRQKWHRGDLVVYATVNGRPAGIGWCARRVVDVPELGRTLRLKPHDAYIHDVFVAPSARGRGVAPAMLEFMAQQLRQTDVYRSWALIASENVASIRAFEKASFTAVADLIYTHVGKKERLQVRPPDPEAKQLLGLK